MKKLLPFIAIFILLSNYAIAQETINGPVDKPAIGLNPLGDYFLYDTKPVGNYALGWYMDSSSPGGAMGYLSGFNGLKFFTRGVPRMAINANGNVGVGTAEPQGQFHILNTSSRAVSIIEGNEQYTYSGLRFVDQGQTTPGKVKEWAIWVGRDGGTWASGLGFNRYDAVNPCNGGICDVSLFLHNNGNVGIGTTNPTTKLAVNGNIRAREVKVENANWPDYVFTQAYKLPTLQETEQHIKEKGHLPGIPSAEEVKTNGVDLGEMNAKLLQKIEELTLHLIELKKTVEIQQVQIEELRALK